MTDKLGLRSTIDLNWDTLKESYFNNENKILDKEKFLNKLLELDEKQKLQGFGKTAKAVGKDKCHREEVIPEDFTKETISCLVSSKNLL